MGSNARTLGDPDGAGLEDWLNDYIGALSASGVANLSLAYSVGSNALTIAAKQQGGTDANSDQPAVVNMRSATATSGDYNVRSITAALSVVVSSGSTLGNANSDSYWNYVYAIDNAGTLELAVSAKFHGMQGVVSTTAEGGAGGADTATVMYSTTARSSVAFRCVGRFKGPQTVAGTWAAVPTSVEMAPFANADSILDGSSRDRPTVATTLGVGAATPATSGAGISFPATQNASSDANTLDDYEEGTWTPSDASGAALSFTSPTGWYIKKGQDVSVGLDLTYPSTADGSSAKIGSLPFTAGNFATPGALAVGYTQATAVTPHLLVAQNQTYITIYKPNGNCINSDFSLKEIQAAGVYRAAA